TEIRRLYLQESALAKIHDESLEPGFFGFSPLLRQIPLPPLERESPGRRAARPLYDLLYARGHGPHGRVAAAEGEYLGPLLLQDARVEAGSGNKAGEVDKISTSPS